MRKYYLLFFLPTITSNLSAQNEVLIKENSYSMYILIAIIIVMSLYLFYKRKKDNEISTNISEINNLASLIINENGIKILVYDIKQDKTFSLVNNELKCTNINYHTFLNQIHKDDKMLFKHNFFEIGRAHV